MYSTRNKNFTGLTMHELQYIPAPPTSSRVHKNKVSGASDDALMSMKTQIVAQTTGDAQ